MISIILPVHNGEGAIHRALRSVAEQRVSKELIIIDDFSTDHTVHIAEFFAANSNFPVRVYELDVLRRDIKSCTGSPNISRNEGVKLARGDYIAFIDADDEFAPTKLGEQLTLMAKWGADVCSCSFHVNNRVYGRFRTVGGDDGRLYIYNRDPIVKFFQRKEGMVTMMSTLCMRKDVFHPFDEFYHTSDFGWTAKTLEKTKFYIHYSVPLLTRYVDGKNLGFSAFNRRITAHDSIIAANYFGRKYPEIAETVQYWEDRALGSLGRYFYDAGNYQMARRYFRRSRPTLKTVGYYITSYVSVLREWIRRRFVVWGDN